MPPSPIRRRCSASRCKTARRPLPRRSIRARSRSTGRWPTARKPSPTRSPSAARRSRSPSASRPRPWTRPCRPHARRSSPRSPNACSRSTCLRPARRRDRPHARRACARRRGDVRQADGAAQRAARQQLGHDPADRRPGRSAVEGSHRRAHGADADACARCRAGCSSRSTASPSASRIRARRSSPPPRRSIRRTPRSTRSWRAGIRRSSACCTRSTPRAQDLDNMMRSYAGMVENAMTNAESPRQAGRLGARPRHRGPGAAGAVADRAPARRSASPYRARGRRPQVELRDGHHPDRPAARADARAVRQRLARHARGGAEDRDRSRLHAAGDAAAHGRPAAADGASHGRHPQGACPISCKEIEAITPVLTRPQIRRAQRPSPTGSRNCRRGGSRRRLRFEAALPIRCASQHGRPVASELPISGPSPAACLSSCRREPAGGEPQRGYSQAGRVSSA